MSNPRELMARLNPQTIKYDVGRGGVSELTNQDIAAALAFVPAGLGREVLTACWWEGGASNARLMDAVLAAVSVEWSRQAKRMGDARTELGIAEAIAGWNRATSPEQRREVERARARYEAVRDESWPRETGAMLPALVKSCVKEIACRNHCADCDGRGHVVRANLVVCCTKCLGSGVVPMSNSARAKAIGRDEASFRRNWSAVYMWLLGLLTEAEQDAARSMAQALSSDRAA